MVSAILRSSRGTGGGYGMRRLFRPLSCVFALAVLAGASGDALAGHHKQAQPGKKTEAASAARHERKAALKRQRKIRHAKHVVAKRNANAPAVEKSIDT